MAQLAVAKGNAMWWSTHSMAYASPLDVKTFRNLCPFATSKLMRKVWSLFGNSYREEELCVVCGGWFCLVLFFYFSSLPEEGYHMEYKIIFFRVMHKCCCGVVLGFFYRCVTWLFDGGFWCIQWNWTGRNENTEGGSQVKNESVLFHTLF